MRAVGLARFSLIYPARFFRPYDGRRLTIEQITDTGKRKLRHDYLSICCRIVMERYWLALLLVGLLAFSSVNGAAFVSPGDEL